MESESDWVISGALRDLVPFAQFEKREKIPWSSATFNKVAQALACNFTKSNTPPWALFTLFKLYKWYQIAQSVSYTKSMFFTDFSFSKC